MAIRFAVASANWSSGSTWDNGALPQSGDVVYPNGFTVNIDTGSTVTTLANAVTPLIVPNIATPIMTSNTTPSGVAFASSQNGLNSPYLAFAQDGLYSTFWQSGVANTGILGYQFTSGKVIKRYVIKGNAGSVNNNPTTWTFQGSNDGTSYTTLETVTAYSMPLNGNYTSGILPNTTSYTYYRVNILATTNVTVNPVVSEFEMTESTGIVLGNNSGGAFNFNTSGVTFNTTNIIPSVANMITITNTTGSVSINCTNNLTSPVNPAITHSGTGDAILTIPTLLVTGNSSVLTKSGTGTLTFTGNILNNITLNANVVNLSLGTLNVIGNVQGSASSVLSSGGISMNGGTLNITGNVTGGNNIGSAGVVTSSGNLTVNGNVSGSTNCAINASTPGTITINGTVSAGSSNSGFLSSNTSATNILSGPLVNNLAGYSAVYCYNMYLTSGTTSWVQYNSTGGTRTLFTDNQLTGYPSQTNVRNGIVYGAGSGLTGSVVMAVPSDVRVNVLSDNTVGTATLTPDDLFNAITASTNPVAVRLTNVSTVSTTGSQIAAYRTN